MTLDFLIRSEYEYLPAVIQDSGIFAVHDHQLRARDGKISVFSGQTLVGVAHWLENDDLLLCEGLSHQDAQPEVRDQLSLHQHLDSHEVLFGLKVYHLSEEKPRL